MSDLPIESIAEPFRQQLLDTGVVLVAAPTGSGKSTRLPVIAADALPSRERVVVLQPRRLAARLVARRVAETTGATLGGAVGFQTRHERVAGDETRILFVTEGLFLRGLTGSNPWRDVGVVMLDEFHERTADAELVLGALRRAREAGTGPRLVVMSATLETGPLETALGVPTLSGAGRSYPVAIEHIASRSVSPIWDQAADAVRTRLAATDDGDVLVFMPGAYEIRRTIEAVRRRAPGVRVVPLYGSLSPAEQDAAVAPHAERTVIVSTNVAETSITIEGVRHVVDAGEARIHRFDPRRGIDTLHIEPISRASADQRAGRAGRTAPGTCVRLWPESEHATRPEHDAPEVHRIDLAGPVLTLAALGVPDPKHFPWLEPPPATMLARAVHTLDDLGARRPDGTLTEDGALMARFPLHPRVSRFLVAAHRRGAGRRAAIWAALIAERDPLMGRGRGAAGHGARSDLEERERALRKLADAKFDADVARTVRLDVRAARDVDRAARQLARLAAGLPKAGTRGDETEALLRALLTAFPDRVAVRRRTTDRSCAMPGLTRVELDAGSVVEAPGPLVALGVREIGHGASVRTVLSLASRLEPEWIEADQPDHLAWTEGAAWDDERQCVVRERARTYDGIVLTRTRHDDVDPAAAATLLGERIVKGDLALERWDATVEQWIARVQCVGEWFPERELIRYDDDERRLIVEEIIEAVGRRAKKPITRARQVREAPCLDLVQNALSWDDRTFVERMAPVSVPLPRDRRMRLIYEPGQAPLGRARIQELYDLERSPTVAGGRIPVRIDILAPNQRPVQRTDDLAGFWATLYPEVRKELRRRYPKHEWRD